MSETSQSVGRIAILAAFTLLFAAAWRSDSSTPRANATPIACSRRASDFAVDAGSPGSIGVGIRAVNPLVEHLLVQKHIPGGRLRDSARSNDSPKTLFSGTPALLGSSTLAPAPDQSRTAPVESLVQAAE